MPAYAYTTRVDRDRQLVKGGTISCDLDTLSIDEAIEALNNLKMMLPGDCSKATLEIDTDYEYGGHCLVSRLNWYRLETPEERDERVKKAEAYNAEVKKRKREEFERLKKELGG